MKVAIVTGSSRGLGRAFAEQLLDRGYFVYAVSRSNKAPKSVDCRPVQADLSQAGAAILLAKNLYPAIKERNPDEILLINNAGTLDPCGQIGSLDLNAIECSFTLNLTAPSVLMAEYLKHFHDEDMPKAIVNISSGAAITAYEGWGPYCAAKSGIDHITRVAVQEQRRIPYPTAIYSIYPGVLDTQMQADIRSLNAEAFPLVERFEALHCEGQLSDPREVATEILSFIHHSPQGGIYDIRDLT